MIILVTGGAGYIGSHVAKALAKAGHLPVVFDNLSRGNSWAVQWGPFEKGDILDDDRLAQLFATYQFDAVIHLAALAYVGESMLQVDRYFQNNVQGTMGLLRAMHNAGVQKIVFSSTCAVYGVPENLPITEETELNPCNPYGQSKLIVEQMLKWYGLCLDLKWVALRYFNAAGCDPDGEIGECHVPETHLIPSLLEALVFPGKPCPIYGSDYPTADGTCVRDYVHVSDLANAHLLALTYLNQDGRSTALNLGTSYGYSISQIVNAIESHTGMKVPIEINPRREGDPPELVASAEHGRRLLGWTPSHSSLDQIIATAWQWTQKMHSKDFQSA